MGTSRIRSPTLSDDIVPTLSLILTLSVENIDYRSLECDWNCLDKNVDAHTNTQILNATIKYILTTKIFDESLFHSLQENPLGFSFHYIMTRMPNLIEDKTASGTGSFVASSFAYY